MVLIDLGQTPEPSHQCREIRAVLFSHGFELQSQSDPGLHMPYFSLGSNVSFRDKKMEFSRRAWAFYLLGRKEQPSRAEIHHG
jgi:hypothetical protein